MDVAITERYFSRVVEDGRQFVRSPGLVGLTTLAMILIVIFIVIPIVFVLQKSMTVGYPTVTIQYRHQFPSDAELHENVLQPVIAALKPIPGLIKTTVTRKDDQTAFLVLRFEKRWDDLKALNDTKRAMLAIQGSMASHVAKAGFRLGKERVYSTETYRDFFSNSRYWHSLRNSIVLAVVSTTLIVLVAFCFAYLGLRGPHRLRGPLRVLGLIPLVAPPFIFSLSLILLGGRSGVIPKLFDLDFNIYGWSGVIIAQVITFLPLGYLMIENVLRSMGANLEDAAADMRAKDYEILFRITIPLAYPGILKAALLVFLMAIADFGNPMLISGNVHFLATDAYLYWVGENNLEMAAVFCVFLIIPSMFMFIIHEFMLKGRSFTTIGGKPQHVEERPISDKIFYPMMVVVVPMSLLIVACFGMIFLGAFTKILMINNTFTLEHFNSPNGIRSLVTSIKFALSAACIAPLIGVTLSYIFVRKRVPFKRALEFLSLLGFAVPGTVMGVGYILAFNAPPLKLTGTFLIMIINEAFRNLSVSLEAGSSKLHQIDVAIEEAAVDMGASAVKTFFRVVLPLISSALIAGFIYTFMVGMIAVSAVIFLISPGKDLAALYILAVAEQGNLGMACAISIMLIVVVLVCLITLKMVGKYTKTEVY
jgi:iron(III) transport system permease protein